MRGISLPETDIRYALCPGIAFAELLIKRCIFPAPTIYTCNMRFRIPFCDCNSQCSAAAAYIQAVSFFRQIYIAGG